MHRYRSLKNFFLHFLPPRVPNRYERAVLSFPPFRKDTDPSASEHKYIMKYVLSVFGNYLICRRDYRGQFWNEIGNIIHHNVEFDGSAPHRFNWVVEHLLSGPLDMIEPVNTFIANLGSMIPSAHLRQSISLKPIHNNLERWSSTFSMLRRH